MALSLAGIIIISLTINYLFEKIKVPSLIGMLFLGIIAGPFVLNLLAPELLSISSDLRNIALIIILLRAGLELHKDTLKRVGARVIILAIIPAIFEGVAITLLAPQLFPITYLEAAILGAILSAVSPAVVITLMLKFIKKRKGTKKGIPSLILASASIGDVIVIIIYSVLLGVYIGNKANIVWQVASVPIAIIIGIVVGITIGWLLYKLFIKYNLRATKQLLILLSVSIILYQFEYFIKDIVPFASLLAIMAIGYFILNKKEEIANELSIKLAKLWIFAEIVLFVLVGSQVNIQVAFDAGLPAIVLIISALFARSIGSYISLWGSELNFNERIFVVISNIPKATVQAAIGGGPLVAMKMAGFDIGSGEIILAIAVLSIIITAPIGAWAIMFTGDKFLSDNDEIIA